MKNSVILEQKKEQSMIIKSIYLKQIAKIAWSLNKTSGIPFEDLYAEGCLACCEAINSFDNKQGTKLTTWIHTLVYQSLVNYVKREKYIGTKNQAFNGDYDYEGVSYNGAQFDDLEIFITHQKPDVQKVLKLTLVNSPELASQKPKFARGRIREILREEGWPWERVWDGIRDAKASINENPDFCII